MQFITSLAAAVFAASSMVAASPLNIARGTLDVYAPPIISPKKGDSFSVNQKVNVTWDASSPPKQITNPIGRVVLGKNESITDTVLADKFNITDGSVEVTIPVVTPADDYFVVLFGDSGDWSGVFSIEADGEIAISI